MDFATASRLVTSPQATAQDLTDICNAFPELRPSAAIHPNAHPELLNWLARLGDPAVNAALATRASRQQPQQPEPSGGTGWIWAVAALIVAAIAFAVWWFWQSDGDDPGIAPTETTEPAESEEPTDEPTEKPTTDEETTPPETDTETDPDAVGTIAELFPDPAFAQCVASHIGKDVADAVGPDDLAAMTDSDYYTNRWGDSFLDDDPIPIESPKMRCEDIASFEGVNLLENLATLSIATAEDVSELDLSYLSENQSLGILEIDGYNPDGFTNDHELTLDFEPIAELPKLAVLRLGSFTTPSLDSIAALPNLKWLLLSDIDGIEDFSFVLDIENLRAFGAPRLDPGISDELRAELEANGVEVWTDID